MLRLEIIANRSIERDLTDAFNSAFPDFYYTLIPLAYGNGAAKPKRGSAIWPEENFVLIVYDSEERVGKMTEILERHRQLFPREGLAYFVLGGPAGGPSRPI